MQRRLNPYDFVRFEETPSAALAVRLDQATGLSGTLRYRLHALTPLVVNQLPPSTDRSMGTFAVLGQQHVIPATSLKGMLRSVHEIVTNSRVSVLSVNDDKPVKDRSIKRGKRGAEEDVTWAYKLDRAGYDPADTQPELTPSERLFGRVRGGDASVGLAGRLLIEDLKLGADQLATSQRLAGVLGGPKPTHYAFYRTEDNPDAALGRKLYYHRLDYMHALTEYARRLDNLIAEQERKVKEARDPETRQKAQHTLEMRRAAFVTLQWVPPQARIDGGAIRFRDLSADELAELVYSVTLEWGDELKLAHKLGYGKPWGLGSVRFEVTALDVEPQGEGGTPERFLDYTAQPTDWCSRVPDLVAQVRARWQARSNGSYSDFCAIARIDPNGYALYPEYREFKGSHASRTLREYQGRANGQIYPGDAFPRPLPAPAADGEADAEAQPERLVGRITSQPLRGYGVLTEEGQFFPLDMITLDNRLKGQLKKQREPRVMFRPQGERAVDIQPAEEGTQ
jgi:hypothetical protein